MHRDLKPENILLSSKGVVKLADFGLIKGETYPGMKGHTAGCGTLLYQSPEQMSGSKYNHKADIFAVGIIGIEIFHPKISKSQIVECIKGRDELPTCKMRLMSTIFMEMISHDPSKRPEIKSILRYLFLRLAKFYHK
jgi:serine/threonine protein kinase